MFFCIKVQILVGMDTANNSFERIILGRTPVLVDFYADWCMPCRILTPILKELAEDMGDEVRVLKINIDTNQKVAKKYGIFSVPTIFLFQEGEVIWKGSGARPKEELKRIIRSNKRIVQAS